MTTPTQALALEPKPEIPSEDVRYTLQLLDALETELDPVMIPPGLFEPDPIQTIEARLERVGLEQPGGYHDGVELSLEGAQELEGVAHVLARDLGLWFERESLGRSRHGLLQDY